MFDSTISIIDQAISTKAQAEQELKDLLAVLPMVQALNNVSKRQQWHAAYMVAIDHCNRLS